MTEDLALVPRPAEGTIHRTLGDETVLLNVDEGQYYVLNTTAGAIWRRCDGRRTLAMIAEGLCEEFEVRPEEAADALLRLMEEFVQAKLVTLEVQSEGR